MTRFLPADTPADDIPDICTRSGKGVWYLEPGRTAAARRRIGEETAHVLFEIAGRVSGLHDAELASIVRDGLGLAPEEA